MDVHRSRFVPYPTPAISALAFSRSSDSGYTGPLPALKLAVGRQNGQIEIWNPLKGSWVQENVFSGNGKGIDSLQWTQEANDTDVEGRVVPGRYRLFSIASSPEVTEWDLSTGRPKKNSTANFSEVWCFAAQPKQKQQQQQDINSEPSQDIAAGCGDGTLVLLSTTDNDLQFKRFLARVSGKRARCMCITYQNRDRIVAGFADSMIRVYDTRNGSVVKNMSLGVGVPGAPKNSLVWQVRCLPNGDIVSADSDGEVKSWDGKMYYQTQRLAGHETDCLDLVTSSDGRTVFSGSIDGKIAVYKQSNQSGRRTWAKTSHRRVHSGEIKAMAAFDSKALSVVVSGGSDTALTVTPLRAYGQENQRSLPSLPQTPPVASASRARLLVSWWDKTICIWRFASTAGNVPNDEQARTRKVVARLNLNTKDNNIRNVAITPSGKVLAVSTNSEVKIFQLRRQTGRDSLGIRKLEVPKELATSGARLVEFAPSGKWLAAVTPGSEVFVARIAHNPRHPKRMCIVGKVVELERLDRKPSQSAFGDYDRTITRLQFSPDGAVLVASDISGYLDSWTLKGQEDLTLEPVARTKYEDSDSGPDSDSDSDSESSDDSDDGTMMFYGQYWTDNRAGHLLPKLESAPLVMTFRPTATDTQSVQPVNGDRGSHASLEDSYRLWILTSTHQMYEFDILQGRLSDWSRRNPTAVLPAEFAQIRDRVMGATWDVSSRKERLWLYGSSYMCMLNLADDLDGAADSGEIVRRKRKPLHSNDHVEDIRKRRKLESGAGGRVDGARQDHVAGSAVGYEADMLADGDTEHADQPARDDDDDEDDDDAPELRLTRMRSGSEDQLPAGPFNGHIITWPKWWCTYKYRPILGVVPLSGEDSEQSDGPLEVVIVERPLWDAKREKK